MTAGVALGRIHSIERQAPDLVAGDLARTIQERYERYLRQRIQVSTATSNRASSLGDPCDRRRVLRRTRGREANPPSLRLQSIFEQGKRGEMNVKRLLSDLGIDLLGSQRDFPPNAYGITGHIDGLAEWQGKTVVVEIKTVGIHFDQLHTVEDVRDHRFTGKWYDQVNLYCLLADLQEYLFVFEGKLAGDLKVIPGQLDHAAVERLLDRAEQDNKHVAAGTLPDFYPIRAECQRCDFYGAVCQPPLEHGPGVKIITDDDLIEAARTKLSTEAAAAAHDKADKLLKERLRGIEMAVIGDVAVSRGKWGPYTSYDVPKEVKEPYKKINPQGMFRLKIEPLAASEQKEGV